MEDVRTGKETGPRPASATNPAVGWLIPKPLLDQTKPLCQWVSGCQVAIATTVLFPLAAATRMMAPTPPSASAMPTAGQRDCGMHDDVIRVQTSLQAERAVEAATGTNSLAELLPSQPECRVTGRLTATPSVTPSHWHGSGMLERPRATGTGPGTWRLRLRL